MASLPPDDTPLTEADAQDRLARAIVNARRRQPVYLTGIDLHLLRERDQSLADILTTYIPAAYPGVMFDYALANQHNPLLLQLEALERRHR